MNKLQRLLVAVVVTMTGWSLLQLCEAAPLTLETVGQTNGLVIFTWTNTAGQTYLLQYKTNLNQGSWDILTGAIITTNARVPASDLIASLGAGRFYRVWILTTNVSDTTKPTLGITAPTSGQSVSNATFLIQGTAADNKLVAAVAYQINSNNWAGAFTANKWTNWSATVGLIPGTNSLKAYAIDTNANISATNSVSFVYVLSALLVVNTNGFGSVNPNYNGALLQLGRGYSMTATAGAGCVFSNWTGSLTTNGATLQFVMASNLMFTANFIDTNRPGLAITAPTNNQRWSNVVFTVTGTASDNVRVANVSYQLNANGWNPAGTANGWSNWTAGVTLIPGTNTVQACSADTTGNKSTTNIVTFFYVVTNQLAVMTNGQGTISPYPNNTWLEIGRSYTNTATAINGHKFLNWVIATNWVGGVTNTNAACAFLMQSNLTLMVNFADTNKPTLTITSPTNSQLWSNAVFAAKGTAGDNVRVSNVWYQLNGTGWDLADTTNAWTNWSANLILQPGTNLLRAYSADLTGNLSTTGSVSFTYIVSDTLRVQTVGRGTLSPNYSNALLQIAKSYSMTATPTNGHAFVSWTISTNWIGGVTTNSPAVQFVMQSNLTLLATFVDTNKPLATITSPTNGQRWSNAVFTVAGTASDNMQATNVWYQLNGAGWNPAATTNGWTNWTSGINLIPGTNLVQAYAADATGNKSTTNSVTFVYVVSDQLRVTAVGKGVLSPNYSNAWLEIGRSYSMTATPTNGHKFDSWEISTNWISPLIATNATLSFLMQSNLTLRVNFTDTNKPSIAISSPTNSQRWSNAVFTVTGTASDNVRVTNVWYQLNGAGWNTATSTNSWTNWQAGVTLMPGTNTVQAYSVDAAGNNSATSNATVVYVLTDTLRILATGRGVLSPNYSNALLEIGKGYSLTATGTNGHRFDHWELSTNWLNPVVTSNATLSFVMQSNLTMQVLFADTNKPTVTISSPTSSQVVSNALINATGTAQDNAGVAAVWCNVNGRGWRLAGTTNNWSNWVARVALNRQTNTLSVYAVDASGNRSTTNSVTFTLKTNQVLETVTQTISAAAGGSITLPSGSRFSIPGGVLSNDMSVTLSIVSTLSQPPPSGLIIGVGPTLVVSFTPVTGLLAKPSSPQPLGAGPVSSQPELSLIYGGEDIVGVAGSESMVDAVDLSGTHQFIGIPGQSTNSGTTFYPSPVLFDNSRTLQFSLGNLKPAVELAPLPTAGSRIWNGTNWVIGLPGFDPNKKTLVLVHGMLSCVENAFGDAAALNAMMAAGGYQQVVGFDYDWTQGIDTSGQQLADFMSTLHSAGLQSADLESHSEGVPVSLSAICRDNSLKINNVVMLGGPIMGTPLAAIGAGVQLGAEVGSILQFNPLLTALLNMPFAQVLPAGMVPPGKSLQDIIEAQFAADLTPDSPVLADNRECVTNKMANTGSTLADARLVTACGCNPPWFTTPASVLFPNGFDGIIGSESCSGEGSGFNPARTSYLGCYSLSHTKLETNRTVINDVALHLNGAPAPYTLTASTAGTGSGMVGVNPVGPYARGLGTKVTLTAVADSGSTFTGWSGDASGTVNPTTVLMTTNRSVTATFTKNRVLIITKAGTGSGTVIANPPGLNPLLTYTNGTAVTLTATPDVISSFAGWSGDVSSASTSVPITMNADKSVTATFNLPALWLAGDGGSPGASLGGVSGCGLSTQLSLGGVIHIEVYNDGASGTITATVTGDVYSPDYGANYYTWQGAVTWNGSAFTGTLPRIDNPIRPSLVLTVTRQVNGQYTATTSLPFTYYVYRLDGSCTGPLTTFNYPINGLVLTPQ